MWLIWQPWQVRGGRGFAVEAGMVKAASAEAERASVSALGTG